MRPGQERSFWAAVTALREAETLAQMADKVSGPADEPPKEDDDHKAWVDDWSTRAEATLQKARQWIDPRPGWKSGAKILRDRAVRIARHVKEGARAIYRASPVGKASETLRSITSAANTLEITGAIATGAATLLLLLGAWYVFKRGKG